ncbi:alpha/beta hydrolase [Actinomycetes bacterium KLBMP 9797]
MKHIHARRLFATTALVAAVTTGLALVHVPAAQARPAAAQAAGAIGWTPCPEDASAECGTLQVPATWSQPGGPMIDMAVARRPATDPAARIGSLIVNPGGPDVSGVNMALWSHFGDDIRRRFDIVGFDPRGVARSTPIMCSISILNRLTSVVDQASFDRMQAATRDLAADCRARSGPHFDHLDTLEVVRDIDALREAVGDPKLSFFGMSYGTLMAQQYAQVFPTRVRAIVADSNMDHSQDKVGFAATQAAAGQDTFDEFVAGCGRVPECALYGRDIRQFWQRLLDRARRHELPSPDDPSYFITEADLVGFVLRWLTAQPLWLEVAAELVRVDEGGSATGRAAAAPRIAADEPPTVVPFAYQAILCADWNIAPTDYPSYRAIEAYAQRFSPDLPRVPRAMVGAICLGWPPANNPQRRIVATNEAKVLLVNSRHDAATGYPWATRVAAQFGSRAVLVTYEGWGHIVYGRDQCADGIIERYLVSLEVPVPGTTCPAVPPPGTAATALDAGGSALAPALAPLGAAPEWPTWRH